MLGLKVFFFILPSPFDLQRDLRCDGHRGLLFPGSFSTAPTGTASAPLAALASHALLKNLQRSLNSRVAKLDCLPQSVLCLAVAAKAA